MKKKLSLILSVTLVFCIVAILLVSKLNAGSIVVEAEGQNSTVKYASKTSSNVEFEEKKDAYVEMKKITSPTAGKVTLTFYYSTSSSVPVEIKVNGNTIAKNEEFAASSSGQKSFTADFKKSSDNKIKFKLRKATTGVKLDKVAISVGDSEIPVVTKEPTKTQEPVKNTETIEPTTAATQKPTSVPVSGNADGYGGNATGGKGGSSVNVSNLSDLKNAVQSSSKMIITVSGNINLGSSSLSIKSNKTLQGKDSNAILTGNVTINNVSNVIVKNLTITNPKGIGTGDGIEVSGSKDIFITKCTLVDCKDGSIDIVRASDYVTVSWCKFQYPNQTEHCFANLIGNSNSATGDKGKLHVTMHHNWYDTGCIERMPRVRFGTVHCYNNYYGSNKTNYVVGVGVYSQILIENCYFDNQPKTWFDWGTSSSDSGKIHWNSGNEFVNTSVPNWAPNSNVFNPPYNYNMDSGKNIKNIVTSGAGNR